MSGDKIAINPPTVALPFFLPHKNTFPEAKFPQNLEHFTATPRGIRVIDHKHFLSQFSGKLSSVRAKLKKKRYHWVMYAHLESTESTVIPCETAARFSGAPWTFEEMKEWLPMMELGCEGGKQIKKTPTNFAIFSSRTSKTQTRHKNSNVRCQMQWNFLIPRAVAPHPNLKFLRFQFQWTAIFIKYCFYQLWITLKNYYRGDSQKIVYNFIPT